MLPNLLPLFLRRERDSNPRYLSVRRFSRPVHSTTLPSLQMLSECLRECISELRVQRYAYFFVCANFSCDFLKNSVKKFVFCRCVRQRLVLFSSCCHFMVFTMFCRRVSASVAEGMFAMTMRGEFPISLNWHLFGFLVA